MSAAGTPKPRASRRDWHSLRLRVLLAILVWVSLGIAGIWFSATRLFVKHVEEQYHEELEVHIRELGGLVKVAPDSSLSLDRPLSDPRYLAPLSGFYWQVGAEGRTALRSPSMTRGTLDASVAHSLDVRSRIEIGPTGPAITYGFKRRGPDGRAIHFLIATDQRLLDAAISRFTRELGVWLAALALALLGTGLAVIAYAFRPLDRLAKAVLRLRLGDRAALKGGFPIEIAPLVDDLNAYIAHNSAVVARSRVEAGNLAHGLRTPLAVIMDEAERLARNPGGADSAQVLLDQAQNMSRQIEFRLALARSATGKGLPGAVSRVREVLLPILSAMRRLHPGIAFEIAGDAAGEAVFPVDPVDFAELLSNLLDNAGKWASRAVSVDIATGPSPWLSITDDGPGMTSEQIARACEVGARFDEGKPGSGLGLAIARDIAETYGLGLQLGARRDNRPGLRVELATDRGPFPPK